MAQFRGCVTGARGNDASRLGTKESGLVVEAQSWQGKVVVHLWHDAQTGRDMCEVTMEQHHGRGERGQRIIYCGPVETYEPIEHAGLWPAKDVPPARPESVVQRDFSRP